MTTAEEGRFRFNSALAPPRRVDGATSRHLFVRAQGGSWLVFAVLFLAPDASFAGYLGGPRIGAAVYEHGAQLCGAARRSR